MKRFFSSDPLHCSRGHPAGRRADSAHARLAGQSAAGQPRRRPSRHRPLDAAGAKPQATAATRVRAHAGAASCRHAAAVPLPTWFVEIDTDKKGEVTRADFLKYRMKTFEQLDTNKDGKLTLEEFLKVAEPPFRTTCPTGRPLEERRARARAEFQNLDTNRDGFVERAEAEALVHAEFNQYDTGPRQQASPSPSCA